MSMNQPGEQLPEPSPFDIFASLVHNDIEFLLEEVLMRRTASFPIEERSKTWLAFEVSTFALRPACCFL